MVGWRRLFVVHSSSGLLVPSCVVYQGHARRVLVGIQAFSFEILLVRVWILQLGCHMCGGGETSK